MTLHELYRKCDNLMPWHTIVIQDKQTGLEHSFKMIECKEFPKSQYLRREVERFRLEPDLGCLRVTLE